MPIVFAAICLFALIALVVAEARRDGDGIFLFKPIASVGFLGVGGTLVTASHGEFGIAVLIGLVLGAAGDVVLMFRERRHSFVAGLVLFLLGHLAYIGAVATVLPPTGWIGLGALGAPLVTGAVLAWLWPSLGSMKVPVVAYAIVITVMFIGAIGFGTSELVHFPEGARIRFALGALLFFASDGSVAYDRFVARSIANRGLGLSAYYVGQLLIASSLVS
ncbi:MAG: lysoplasmalogenase [Polyangiales bacterium]